MHAPLFSSRLASTPLTVLAKSNFALSTSAMVVLRSSSTSSDSACLLARKALPCFTIFGSTSWASLSVAPGPSKRPRAKRSPLLMACRMLLELSITCITLSSMPTASTITVSTKPPCTPLCVVLRHGPRTIRLSVTRCLASEITPN